MSVVIRPLIPSRFEAVMRKASDADLRAIVVRVDDGLHLIDDAHDDMESSGIGAFRVVRGQSGCGKSTLLGTLPLFKRGVETVHISSAESIESALEDLPAATSALRVVVIEGRESAASLTSPEVERALRTINWFIRSDAGRMSLVVWPCNVDPLVEQIVATGLRLGGEALLGVGAKVFDYQGPPREQYAAIAERTIATLNGGASLVDLGISAEHAEALAGGAETIGAYLALLRQQARNNLDAVQRRLPDREAFSVWVVVIAGNEPEGDVAALTRGSLSHADVDRLLSATQANVVRELSVTPERVGVLGTMLDTRIIHLPALAAMDAVRDQAPDALRTRLAKLTFKAGPTGKAAQRIHDSDLGRALAGKPLGTKRRGAPIGSNTVTAFEKLAAFASSDDAALNRTVGGALVEAALVEDFDDEVGFSGSIELESDLVVRSKTGTVRLEMMWRRKTSRAEIAKYVLEKLQAYGRAIGYLA